MEPTLFRQGFVLKEVWSICSLQLLNPNRGGGTRSNGIHRTREGENQGLATRDSYALIGVEFSPSPRKTTWEAWRFWTMTFPSARFGGDKVT